MAYAYALMQWKTVAEFRMHLDRHNPDVAPWAKGVVLHHTWRPTPSQWNGKRTMDAMSARYQAMGWRGGPHLFIVLGSPKVENDGIWQMCPLNVAGIHCSDLKGNASMWGVTSDTLKGHREYQAARKTCPGSAINMDMIRTEFKAYQGKDNE